jgi:hypothetical protein
VHQPARAAPRRAEGDHARQPGRQRAHRGRRQHWFNTKHGGGCGSVDGDQAVRRNVLKTFVWGGVGEPRFILHTGSASDRRAGKIRHDKKFGTVRERNDDDLPSRRIGYEAYAANTGGKTFDGHDMPKGKIYRSARSMRGLLQ